MDLHGRQIVESNDRSPQANLTGHRHKAFLCPGAGFPIGLACFADGPSILMFYRLIGRLNLILLGRRNVRRDIDTDRFGEVDTLSLVDVEVLKECVRLTWVSVQIPSRDGSLKHRPE